MLSEITTKDLKTGIILSNIGITSSITEPEVVYLREDSENFISYPLIKESGEIFLCMYQNLLQNIHIDLSTLNPNFDPQSETFLTESPYKETMDEEDFEYDVVFRIPPKRTYKIILEIKSIEKAVPKFVSPEE